MTTAKIPSSNTTVAQTRPMKKAVIKRKGPVSERTEAASTTVSTTLDTSVNGSRPFFTNDVVFVSIQNPVVTRRKPKSEEKKENVPKKGTSPKEGVKGHESKKQKPPLHPKEATVPIRTRIPSFLKDRQSRNKTSDSRSDSRTDSRSSGSFPRTISSPLKSSKTNMDKTLQARRTNTDTAASEATPESTPESTIYFDEDSIIITEPLAPKSVAFTKEAIETDLENKERKRQKRQKQPVGPMKLLNSMLCMALPVRMCVAPTSPVKKTRSAKKSDMLRKANALLYLAKARP
jgi:hypothetical protein